MAWLTVLGIPATAYVMCVTALLFHMNDRTQDPVLLVGAGLLTAGIYIFHRTSISPVEPMQERHRIALKYRKSLRVLAFLLGVLAMAVFSLHHPMATLLVFGALTGVIAYGRKTITRPLRTFLYLKPIAVGTAIVCFAWALNDWSNSIHTILGFILICSADSLLCDIIDVEYDAASGCDTLALKLGAHWSRILASILYLIGSVGFLFSHEQNPIGVFFFVVFVFTIFVRFSDQRSLVDLRMLLVVLLAWGEWLFWTTALG